jgi:hypothetical protein
MKSDAKQKSQSVDNGNEKLRLITFENEVPCEAIVDFQIRGRTTAAYLLRKGGEKSESFQFVFGFETKGVHTTLKSNQVDPIFDGIESGLKDLLPGEKFTIHFSSFSVDETRQRQLSELVLRTNNPRLQFLLLAEKKRITQLTKKGLRKKLFEQADWFSR